MRQLFVHNKLVNSSNAVPVTIIFTTRPSVVGSIDLASEGSLDTVKEDFVGGRVMVGVDVPINTDCRLGIDTLWDGAGLCVDIL